jgi:hypothetical protein
MSELSPAAQAVAKAALYVSSCDPEEYPHQAQEIAAAALRAAADQVVPPALEEEFFDRNHALPLQKKVEIRLSLLAIAAELEGAQ